MPTVWVSNDGGNMKGNNDSNKVFAELKTIRVSVYNVLSPILNVLT